MLFRTTSFIKNLHASVVIGEDYYLFSCLHITLDFTEIKVGDDAVNVDRIVHGMVHGPVKESTRTQVWSDEPIIIRHYPYQKLKKALQIDNQRF